MFDLFVHVTEAILSIAKILRLRKPGKVFLVVKKEDNGMLYFVLLLPAPSASDVVKREVSLQIGDAERQTLELEGNAGESSELSGEQGATVSGSLVDIDDAGNRSEPRDFEFTLTDTLAPGQPGEVNVRITREEDETPLPPIE